LEQDYFIWHEKNRGNLREVIGKWKKKVKYGICLWRKDLVIQIDNGACFYSLWSGICSCTLNIYITHEKKWPTLESKARSDEVFKNNYMLTVVTHT
jgi:hypothetical protein